ncbi:uncharacterized protein TRIADDRAFT_58557 [Trichoplax adhaerens]|uniref:G-protein coupled receptors family 1 profile domain-containing protein n=1 Tax=Trichoplax adhaerens TaxID=10228 RepID=B3S312_TRIAD|nr:hypothetical protein TRIADDRAFT_58557 [Trichoplax adhaerens]EDV22712.1 hypothetical protein TRIADDRAFT_58557 [Trichoplax adhaerens]|eukprot:XP_002114578.1 hypothetical protein TRIADDRAFT_58557 [Trichoplax adhaerens]
MLVFLTFYKHASLRTTSNLFIINLAITDLLTGGIKDTLFIYGLTSYNWPKSAILCSFVGFINCVCYVATVYTLTVIAVFRYLAIVCNLGRKIKRKHSILTIACVWIYSSACCLMPIIGWSRYIYEPTECTCVRSLDKKYYSYTIYILVADFLLPLSVVSFCYGNIFAKMKRNHHHIKRDLSDGQKLDVAEKLSRREEIVARRMFIILAEHVVCFLPYTIIVTMLAANGVDIEPVWYFIVGYLLNLNSALNPVTYIVVNPRLKKGYISVICCKDNFTRVKPTKAGGNQGFLELRNVAK